MCGQRVTASISLCCSPTLLGRFPNLIRLQPPSPSLGLDFLFFSSVSPAARHSPLRFLGLLFWTKRRAGLEDVSAGGVSVVSGPLVGLWRTLPFSCIYSCCAVAIFCALTGYVLFTLPSPPQPLPLYRRRSRQWRARALSAFCREVARGCPSFRAMNFALSAFPSWGTSGA